MNIIGYTKIHLYIYDAGTLDGARIRTPLNIKVLPPVIDTDEKKEKAEKFLSLLNSRFDMAGVHFCINKMKAPQNVPSNFKEAFKVLKNSATNLDTERDSGDINVWENEIKVDISYSVPEGCFNDIKDDYHLYGFFTGTIDGKNIAGKTFESKNGFSIFKASEVFGNKLNLKEISQSWVTLHEIGHNFHLNHGCSDIDENTARIMDEPLEECYESPDVLTNDRNSLTFHVQPEEFLKNNLHLPGNKYNHIVDENYHKIYYKDILNHTVISCENDLCILDDDLSYIELKVVVNEENIPGKLLTDEFIKRMLFDLDFNLNIDNKQGIDFNVPVYEFNQQDITIYDNKTFGINIPVFINADFSPYQVQHVNKILKAGEVKNFEVKILEPNSINQISQSNENNKIKLNRDFSEKYESNELLYKIMSGYYPYEKDVTNYEINSITELLNDEELPDEIRSNIYIGLQNYNSSIQLYDQKTNELKIDRFNKLCSRYEQKLLNDNAAYDHYKNNRKFNCNSKNPILD